MKYIKLVFILFIVLSITANAQVEIDKCQTLSTAGQTYILNQSFNTSNGACLTVGANNITISGGGHTIRFANISIGRGISSTLKNNITIKDIKIEQMNTTLTAGGTDTLGIYFDRTNNSIIYNSSITSFNNTAVLFASTENNTISLSNIRSNLRFGVYLNINKNLTMVSNNISSNGSEGAVNKAVYLITVTNSNFSDNIINSIGNNFYITTSSNYNNFTNNTATNNDSSSSLLIASGSTSLNNTFIRNSFSSNTSYGLYLGTGGNVFSNNVFKSSTLSGVYILTGNSSFDNNTFQSDKEYGINISYSNTVGNTFSNNTVISPFASTSTRHNILLIGDSVTYGTGSTHIPGGYGYFLNQSLQSVSNTWIVSDRGIVSEKSGTGLKRFSNEIDIYHPQIVTIMYGINDLFFGTEEEDIIQNITDMANISMDKGIRTYILTTTNTSYSTGGIKSLDINLTLQASALGITVINTYDAVDSVPNNNQYDSFYNYTIDGTHFNDVGYELLGNKIFSQINSDYYPLPSASFQAVSPTIDLLGLIISIVFVIMIFNMFINKAQSVKTPEELVKYMFLAVIAIYLVIASIGAFTVF